MENNNDLKISLFNSQFSSLLSELVELYPLDPKLKLLQNAANSMIYMNPLNFSKTVIDYLKPYNKFILEKNEEFFLNEIISDFEDHSFIADEIRKVHSIWIDPSTLDSTKESIWKYFIFMVKIGKSINFQ
jgi:hypothetical protein